MTAPVVPLTLDAINAALARGEVIMFVVKPKAYTMKDAAVSACCSVDTLNRAAEHGDLVKSYHHSKPVILDADLDRYLSRLPKQPH